MKDINERYVFLKGERDRLSSLLTESATRKDMLVKQRDGLLEELRSMGLNSYSEAVETVKRWESEIEELVLRAEGILEGEGSGSSVLEVIDEPLSFTV